MKSSSLLVSVLTLLSSSYALAQSQPLPSDPLLKQTAQCFRSLLVLNKNSKSSMQFYGESVQTKGPNCFPMMLVVRSEGRMNRLSVYRDNASGNMEGFTINHPKGSSEKLGFKLPGGKASLDYACRFTSPEMIAQYGANETRREVVLDPRSNPPRLITSKDFFESGEKWKLQEAKQGHDSRELLRSIRREIAIRLDEAGRSPSRVFFRDNAKDLGSCLELITTRKGDESKQSDEDQHTAGRMKALIETLTDGGSKSKTQGAKSVR